MERSNGVQRMWELLECWATVENKKDGWGGSNCGASAWQGGSGKRHVSTRKTLTQKRIQSPNGGQTDVFTQLIDLTSADSVSDHRASNRGDRADLRPARGRLAGLQIHRSPSK